MKNTCILLYIIFILLYFMYFCMYFIFLKRYMYFTIFYSYFAVFHNYVLLILLSILPVPSVDGHGVPFFSVCRAFDHFYYSYVHTFTETLCIGNYLSSFVAFLQFFRL